MNNTPALRDEHVRDMTVAWAEGLAAAHRIASALCVTAFAPAHFKGKPEEAAAAILYGAEVGFTPTQSLAHLYVISGKPAMYARAMVALAQGAGHEVWTEDKTDESVTVCGRRRGSEHVTRETWTTQRAHRAGYTNNKKYQTDPQAMLYARAASDVCRQIAADVLAGIGHTVEEMQLTRPENPPAQAAPKAAASDFLPATETGELVSDEQVADLVALMDRKGSPADKRVAFAAWAIKQPIADLSELTVDQWQTVAAELEKKPDVAVDGDPFAQAEEQA